MDLKCWMQIDFNLYLIIADVSVLVSANDISLFSCCNAVSSSATPFQLQHVLIQQCVLLQCLHGATLRLLYDDRCHEKERGQGQLRVRAGTYRGNGSADVQQLQGLLNGIWISQALLR